jgi:hypothetical protein
MEPLSARPARVSGVPLRPGGKFLLTGEPDRVFMGHFLKETFVMERLKLRNLGFWFSYYYFYGQVCPSLRRT